MDPTLYTAVRGQAGQRTYAQLKRCLLLSGIPLRIQRGESASRCSESRPGVLNQRNGTARKHEFLTKRIARTIPQHLGVLEAFLPDDFANAHRRFTMHLGQSIALTEQRAPRPLARMMADLP
jgi:hypothetical protein